MRRKVISINAQDILSIICLRLVGIIFLSKEISDLVPTSLTVAVHNFYDVLHSYTRNEEKARQKKYYLNVLQKINDKVKEIRLADDGGMKTSFYVDVATFDIKSILQIDSIRDFAPCCRSAVHVLQSLYLLEVHQENIFAYF